MTVSTITPLDYALLGLLEQAPRSGYDLRKIFETMALGSYSGSPGAIYPALRRLEQLGLIEGEVDATKALRPKKVFRPTRIGEETLRRWLARDIEREDVVRRLDELMLRFAFHAALGSRRATRHFLEAFLNGVDGYLAELNRQRKALPDETPRQSRLALVAGIEQYRACTRWARKAIKEFEEQSP